MIELKIEKIKNNFHVVSKTKFAFGDKILRRFCFVFIFLLL